ncbi:MAG: sigma-70 family RNA polymerase sigma factor [Saprospiraceae bacterium]
MTAYLTEEDHQLVQACLQKERQAQRQLYNKYIKAMYHLVIRMIPDTAATEDIVQESFIKVFQYLDHFKGESSLGAWIKRITINTTLSHLRKKEKLVFTDEFVGTALEDVSTPEQKMVFDIQKIHDAIKQLPAGSRMVLSLHLLEGYQHQEIAQILNISVSTSKTQYRRARLLLQQALKNQLF